MRTVVLDANVAAKWTFPASTEPLAMEANHLLGEYTAERLNFIVPDLFWAEVASVLRKAVRQKKCSHDTAQEALSEMRDRGLLTVSSQTVVENALEIALHYDQSVYDAIYVALAVSARTELVTADERLVNALAARFPVKWLGIF